METLVRGGVGQSLVYIEDFRSYRHWHFLDAVLFVDDHLLCFAMQSSAPLDCPDEKKLLEEACDSNTGIHQSCINTDRLFQIPTGPGWT